MRPAASASRFASSSRVIFDLGMNNGDDTDFYLKRGFRVVALEANPKLCRAAERRFASQVADGLLQIVHAAIWERPGRQTFYVNRDNDHWSSLDPAWATRNDSAVEAVEVECVTLAMLFERHGVPKVLKIDVEGVDHVVLDQLRGAPLLPQFVSVEDCRFGYEYMAVLQACGYADFKLFDQSTVTSFTDPLTGHRFPAGSSGPLGPDLPGDWLSYADMVATYERTVRDRQGNRLATRDHWWDIHCTRL